MRTVSFGDVFRSDLSQDSLSVKTRYVLCPESDNVLLVNVRGQRALSPARVPIVLLASSQCLEQ